MDRDILKGKITVKLECTEVEVRVICCYLLRFVLVHVGGVEPMAEYNEMLGSIELAIGERA